MHGRELRSSGSTGHDLTESGLGGSRGAVQSPISNLRELGSVEEPAAQGAQPKALESLSEPTIG